MIRNCDLEKPKKDEIYIQVKQVVVHHIGYSLAKVALELGLSANVEKQNGDVARAANRTQTERIEGGHFQRLEKRKRGRKRSKGKNGSLTSDESGDSC